MTKVMKEAHCKCYSFRTLRSAARCGGSYPRRGAILVKEKQTGLRLVRGQPVLPMVFQASKRNTVRRCLKTAAPRSTMLLTRDLRDKCWSTLETRAFGDRYVCWSTLEMTAFGVRRVCWSTLETRAFGDRRGWEPSMRKTPPVLFFSPYPQSCLQNIAFFLSHACFLSTML